MTLVREDTGEYKVVEDDVVEKVLYRENQATEEIDKDLKGE